ncbi:hypothetical protein GQ53DRAFT_817332 [Thozetella sp. PMI_491]|nr:hypothetical protein GQ53DRAFT_817332 [Thozetella sp. PMI_491]
MTILSDAGIKFEHTAAMSNSPISPSAAADPAPVGDEAASTITVNTKAPANNFPPPKTDKPRPHVCATCQRSFARLEHLKRHERSHTKEKPFECPECTRCFARRDLLLRHQQKLHQTTTPSSRPRNRRESASGATPGAGRVRKNSVAGPVAAAAAANATAAAMRPRANTISHIDGASLSMLTSANPQVARMPAHSRHPSLVGLPMHNMDHHFAGMAAAMGHRGMAHGLPKLETHGINNMDFSSGLRTAPPMALFNPEFDFEGLLFGPSTGSTINPNALHYNDSPQSMAIDPMSPFPHHGLADTTGAGHVDDGFDWLTGFDHQMSFNNAGPNENAVDGSSPSAISTTSQSGISDVMLDGSNHHPTTSVGTSTMWAPGLMGPPQMTNPFSLDMGSSVFPDLLNGAPVSPQPPAAKNMGDAYFSTPPPSLSSLSPSVISGLNSQNLSQALHFGTGPETPSSLNGSNHGTLPVSTITDSTRNAILGALSASPASQFGGRRYSFASSSSPLSPHAQIPNSNAEQNINLPNTHDLQRYVSAYLRYVQPHLPFLHVPTLSFEIPKSANGRGASAGSGCLLLSMAAIGALYELEHHTSRELFSLAKRMIQLYLDERRKANVRKADFRRPSMPGLDHASQQDSSVETPVWLVQAMLLNVVYGHNCGDKRSGEIASTHAAALVSLAQGAELLRPVRMEGSKDGDVGMIDGDGTWTSEADEHAEWLRWKAMEERKRTLYVVFILSSLLVLAYNHTPALTNSEIHLDLPCDEEFFAAESSATFNVKGGVAGANHNRMSFRETLGKLLSSNANQHQLAFNSHHGIRSAANLEDLPKSDLKPSTFGSLVLINALHNYIWETRQRHHNKIWTNEETEKMHRHIEPALRAWQAAWASNPHHSPERPNPFGKGPLSADAIPLLDLAYVRLFVNLSRTKEKFWQRDWDGLAEELARGSEVVQHAEQSPESNADSAGTDPSDGSGNSSVFMDSPATQSSSSPDANAAKFAASGTINPALTQQHPGHSQNQSSSSRATSRREKHLRKAAFFAADSLSMSDKLGVTFADLTSRELPLQSAMCAFDSAQVLAEWVATLQDRVGRYLGILGQDEVDLSQVPAIMLLEEEDVKLLGKVQEVLAGAEIKMNIDMSADNGVSGLSGPLVNIGIDGRLPGDDHNGYAAKILRVTAYMLDKAAVWPVTKLMARCLESHTSHMRARAEKSVLAPE